MVSYKLKYILLFCIAVISLYILYNYKNKEYFMNYVEEQDRKIDEIETNIKNELNQEIKKDMHQSKYCVGRTSIPSSLNINKENTILGFGPNIPFINKYYTPVPKGITPTPSPSPSITPIPGTSPTPGISPIPGTTPTTKYHCNLLSNTCSISVLGEYNTEVDCNHA